MLHTRAHTQRHTETHRDTQRHTETHRHSHTHTHTETHRDTHTQTHTDTHAQTHRHTHRHTHIQTHTHTHTDTHTDTHTQRHTHRHTHTDTDTQTHTHKHTITVFHIGCNLATDPAATSFATLLFVFRGRHQRRAHCLFEHKLEQTGNENRLSAIFFKSRTWCKPGPKSRNNLYCRSNGLHQRLLVQGCLNLHFFAEFVISEGCIWTMTSAGVSDTWTPQQLLQGGTKSHGTRPETRPEALAWFPAQKPVVKRSIKRAFARSVQHGVSWYLGRCLTPNNFPKALRDSYKPSILPSTKLPSKPLMHCPVECRWIGGVSFGCTQGLDVEPTH